MGGYHDKPEQTAEALAAAGCIPETSRSRTEKASCASSIARRTCRDRGFNVYPREIEDVLGGHPWSPRAVVGVRTSALGEAVKAVVVLRPARSVRRRS